MTFEEAEEIISKYIQFEDISCSCHCGMPPCSKCVDRPSEEDYEEALLILEENKS